MNATRTSSRRPSWAPGFGEFDASRGFKTVDERVMRGSAGIMLALAMIALVNGFVLDAYIVIPWISGFFVLNFLIGILVDPKLSPTVALSTLLVRKQAASPIGALPKQFAWSLGLVLSTSIFVMSLFLLTDDAWFSVVCQLCIICVALLYLETAFAICVGCKLHKVAVRVGLLRQPETQPNCMGDACETETT